MESDSHQHEMSVMAALPPTENGYLMRADYYMLCIFAIVGAAVSWTCSEMVFQAVLEKDLFNIWFDADCIQVNSQMTERWSREHDRAQRHPFFSLLTMPIVWVLNAATQITAETIIRTMLAMSSACTGVIFYLICRRITGRIIAAAIWTTLLLTSSGFIFWSGVPETFCFGMPTILLPFAVLAYGLPKPTSEPSFTFTTLLSLSITVTNVMSGLVCTLLAFSPRRTFESLKNVVCLAVGALIIQAVLIPKTADSIFFCPNLAGEAHWMNRPEAGGILTKARAVLLYGELIPQVEGNLRSPVPQTAGKTSTTSLRTFSNLTVQTAPYSRIAQFGVAIWLGLLSFGIYNGLSQQSLLQLMFRALSIVVLGQLALHLVYGLETFLYSAHFGPLLILLSAFACRTRYEPIVIGLAGILVTIQTWNNASAFRWCSDYVQQAASAGLGS
ncbi:MAG: hypothetical protein GY880_04350 [Planctomycetaceae bacterium]|nr:hypothetical protein [Planctomycetaceae bacterium]